MEDSYEVAIQGLIRKRAELAGRVNDLNDQLTAVLVELDHIDGALHVLDPDLQAHAIPPRATTAANVTMKWQTTRLILSMLRDEGPLTTAEIAMRMVQSRGLNAADKRLVRVIHERAGSRLRKLRSEGKVVSEGTGESGLLRWRVG